MFPEVIQLHEIIERTRRRIWMAILPEKLVIIRTHWSPFTDDVLSILFGTFSECQISRHASVEGFEVILPSTPTVLGSGWISLTELHLPTNGVFQQSFLQLPVIVPYADPIRGWICRVGPPTSSSSLGRP